jgi:Family of unknown function (DUF6171)
MSEDRSAKPWDLLNKNIGRVEDSVAIERMDICKSCEYFLKVTGQCKKCGCIMAMKTKLPNATCPLEKW